MTRIFILLLAVIVLPPVSLWGADVRQQLKGIKKEIKEKKQLITKTTRVENIVTGELAKIDLTLKEKQASLDALNRDLLQVEKNLKRTASDILVAKSDVTVKRRQIEKRLVSIYKAGYVGDIRFLFSSESFPQMVEGQRYMKSLLQRDRQLIAEYNGRIDRLKGLQGSLEREAQKNEKIKSSIELKKNEIEAEKRKKADYLSKVKEDKRNYQASLQELEANSKRLQGIIQRLEMISRQRAAKQKKAAANVKKKGISPRTSPSSPTPVEPPSVSGFGSQKGRLSIPVRGQITSGFGRHKHPQFNSYTFNNGISVSAPAGTDVHAIYDGRVIFAEYFKGYGNLLILDHGGGYFSLYAHNSRILKRVGAVVAKNETLASVGDVDSANGPTLYFEIRYQGKPIDPSPWIR